MAHPFWGFHGLGEAELKLIQVQPIYLVALYTDQDPAHIHFALRKSARLGFQGSVGSGVAHLITI